MPSSAGAGVPRCGVRGGRTRRWPLSAGAVTLAASLLLAPARPALAGGFMVPDIGVRRNGMGAMIGRPDELSAVYHNPAGLTLLPGLRLYVNLGVAIPTTSMRLRPWPESDKFVSAPVDGDGYYPSTKPKSAYGVIPMIVASTNVLSEKLWLALSFYVPNAIGSAMPADGITRYHMVRSYMVAGNAGLTAAWKPRPWLSAGASLNVIYVQLYGTRKLFPILPDPNDPSKTLDLTAIAGSQTDLTVTGSAVRPGWNFGLLLRPHRTLTLGATVIGQTDVTLKGDVTIQTGADAPAQMQFKCGQKTAIVIPWIMLYGANWDVTRKVEIGAEYRHYFYRVLQSQHTAIEDGCFISSLDSPKHFHDSWQVAGGVRVHSLTPRLRRLELMLGFHYDYSPSPDNTVSMDAPTFNHVGLRSGLRYRLGDRYLLGLAYSHFWYLQRRTDASLTTPPTNFVGSGSNNIITATLEVTLGRGIRVR